MRWAAPIQRIYEVNHLECTKHAEAKLPKRRLVRRRNEKRQMDVIEKILRHCGLWIELRDRGPPAISITDDLYLELEYVSFKDVLMDF